MTLHRGSDDEEEKPRARGLGVLLALLVLLAALVVFALSDVWQQFFSVSILLPS